MKVHGRRVLELTETGLQNLTMLFLLLAHVADINDVVGTINWLAFKNKVYYLIMALLFFTL